MADTVQGIRSVPLHDLIGATLVAIIQADAQAARATLEFIETVGFVPSGEGSTGDGFAPGDLRMAEFRYKKLDENNEVAEFVAAVPLLSLVPIPALQIKDARLKFSAQITDIATEKPAPQVTATPAALATNVGRVEMANRLQLQSTQYRLLAKPVAASGAKDQEVRGSFHLEVELTMGQADLPLGMEKLFTLMDTAIQDSKPEQG
ncbi:MAG: hypothetical protein Kow0077_21380 [Anaerolineae bacterium]